MFVMPSYREGLSVAMMEAMSCGLPVIASNIRGNCDLVDEEGGFLFDIHNIDELVGHIETLSDKKLYPVRQCQILTDRQRQITQPEQALLLRYFLSFSKFLSSSNNPRFEFSRNLLVKNCDQFFYNFNHKQMPAKYRQGMSAYKCHWLCEYFQIFFC